MNDVALLDILTFLDVPKKRSVVEKQPFRL